MSHNVRTRPADLPEAEPLDDLDAPGRPSPFYLMDRVWRFFISKKTGLVLILAMGLLSLVGTLLAQAPDDIRGDSAGYAAWLDSVRPKYGGWTDLLSRAGLFHVFSSIWFEAVSALLAVSILACTWNRAPRLWRRATRPRVHMADSFFTRAALGAVVAVPVPPARALEAASAALRAHRFRTIVDPQGQGRTFYADRFRFGPFGTLLAHIGFVVIIAGVVLSGSTGFKNNQFTVPVGSRVEVGYGTGLAVQANSFNDSYYPDGSPRDYASDLAIYRGGQVVARQTVRVNEPLSYGGITFHQAFFGTAAAVRVRDSAGRTVYDSAVPLNWTSSDGKHSIGQFTLPNQGLSVYVVMAASGEVDPNIGAGQVQLEIYQRGQDSQPIATQVIDEGKASTISGLSYTFRREVQFTGLIVSRDPGAIWVWTGSVLMVLGLFAVFFFPHRRIWVRVNRAGAGSEVRFATPTRRDSGFSSLMRRVEAQLKLAGEPAQRQQKAGPEDA